MMHIYKSYVESVDPNLVGYQGVIYFVIMNSTAKYNTKHGNGGKTSDISKSNFFNHYKTRPQSCKTTVILHGFHGRFKLWH